MSVDDLPMISPSSDSTQVELTPQKEVRVNAPEPRRNPTTQVPRPAPPAAPAPAARPPAPMVKAPIPPAAAPVDDEDPEKLLREYTERQKTKVVRLEQQLVEYKKVVAERDGLRAKVDAMSKELQEARRQLDASLHSEEMIKDLQAKVDAAVLSNSILSEDKEKLKKGLSQQTEHFAKSQERAELAEKSLAEAQEELARQTQAREGADAKVAAALKALQSDATPAKPAPAAKSVSEAVTRAMKPVPPDAPAAKAPEEKPATTKLGAGNDEKAASTPPASRPPQRPPGRFSFLRK